MENRSTFACRHCGHSYEGRGIFADHGLAQHNLEKHEAVCLDQQRARAEAETRRQEREARRYRRSQEKAAVKAGRTPPLPGQLGFPGFEGVPAEVA